MFGKQIVGVIEKVIIIIII